MNTAAAIIAFICLFHVLLANTTMAMVDNSADNELLQYKYNALTTNNVSSMTKKSDLMNEQPAVAYYAGTEIPITYKKNITVGYLTALKGYTEKQGLTISGAVTYALEQVSKRTSDTPLRRHIHSNHP